MDEDKPPTEDLDSTETARAQSPILPERIGNDQYNCTGSVRGLSVLTQGGLMNVSPRTTAQR